MSEIVRRQKQRDLRALRSIAAGMIFQVIYVLVQFASLAVLFRSVGQERFGMWITIFGMTMWLGLLPLGMYRAVLTWLGRVAIGGEAKLIWRIIEASFGVVTLMCLAAAAGLVLLGDRLPWALILNVTGSEAVRDAGPTAVAALVMMALSLPPALGGFVLQSYQRGATRHVLGMVGQVIGLGLLLIGVWRDWSLPAMGVCIVSPIMTAGLLQWVAVWRLLPPRPPRGIAPLRILGPMLSAGLGLWLAELALILIVNSGPLVVAQASGAASVAAYGAVYRLVGPLFVCYVVIGQAYWPAFGEAAGSQDQRWIFAALRRATLIGAAIWLLGAVVCVLAGEWFIVRWLGEEARPGMAMIVAGLVFALAHGIYHLTAAVLGGLGHIRRQAAVGLIVLGLYGVAAWWSAARLNATTVMLLQGAGVGLIGVLCAVELNRRLNGRSA